MRIYTLEGTIPHESFTFPDGQRHVKLLTRETRADNLQARIETAIASSGDLVDVLLAKDALDASGYITSLDIRYLLGARMDRRIDCDQPSTLEVVCRLLLGAGFRKIRVLDPHSDRALKLLDATAVYPYAIVEQVLQSYHPQSTVVIAPDEGARQRVSELVPPSLGFPVRNGYKTRDSNTGQLSRFGVEDPSFIAQRKCLIVDDICDGGGTFSGLGDVLMRAGAQSVDLFVTHGIFSKNLPLQWIKKVFTTDSRKPAYERGSVHPVVFPVDMSSM